MMKGNLSLIAVTLFALLIGMSATSSSEPTENSASGGVIEILTLDIKPGRRAEFHKVYVAESLPLLKRWNFNVVAYGPSLHDANSYYVIRSFKSLEDRQKSEDTFYSSDDWQQGPRDSIMGFVEHFAYAVVSAETWKKISAGVITANTDAK
jgi:NIPSNAP